MTTELFRHCPQCGRRFHVILVGKTIVDKREETTIVKTAISTMPAGSARGGMGVPLVVEEDVPTTINVEDFQYSYKCKHCGHEWSETRTEQSRA